MKTIKMHTYDLQRIIIIACISKTGEERHRRHDVKEAEAYDKLADLFTDINRLCKADNDYTITITVDDGRDANET